MHSARRAPVASLTQLVAPGAERIAEAGRRRAAQAAGAVRALRARVDKPRGGGGRGGRRGRHRCRVGRARRVCVAPAGACRLRRAGRLRNARRAAAELPGTAALPLPCSTPPLSAISIRRHKQRRCFPLGSSQMTSQTKAPCKRSRPARCAHVRRTHLATSLGAAYCLGLVAAPCQHRRGRRQSRAQH